MNSLGLGFQLASHDLDLRGSGNIIGDEQSGHIREIGLELYHRLLREKISDLKNEDSLSNDSEWSPQINLGLTVLIPEKYMPNLNSRLHYYKKLAYALDKSELSFISDSQKEFLSYTTRVAVFNTVYYQIIFPLKVQTMSDFYKVPKL